MNTCECVATSDYDYIMFMYHASADVVVVCDTVNCELYKSYCIKLQHQLRYNDKYKINSIIDMVWITPTPHNPLEMTCYC